MVGTPVAAIEIAKAKHEKFEVRDALKTGKTPPQPPPPVPGGADRAAPRAVRLIERVAVLLARAAPKGIMMTRDELAGWLVGMTAYNDGASAFWTETYGGRPYRVDRVKHPRSDRRAAACRELAQCGIQPDRLAEVMREADDGLLSRHTWFWPEPIPFRIVDKPPTVDWAAACFDRLRMLDLTVGANGPQP